MKFRTCSHAAATLLGAVVLTAVALPAARAREKKLVESPAAIDQAYKPIPKPDNRRPGELEGWSDTDKTTSAPTKPKAKAAASAKKSKSAKSEEKSSDGATANGGLPLPSGRGRVGGPESGMTFDDKGNLGTGFKF